MSASDIIDVHFHESPNLSKTAAISPLVFNTLTKLFKNENPENFLKNFQLFLFVFMRNLVEHCKSLVEVPQMPKTSQKKEISGEERKVNNVTDTSEKECC